MESSIARQLTGSRRSAVFIGWESRMKYHMMCAVPEWDGFICEYETDGEPPRVGDFFTPRFITDGRDINTYRVVEVLYQPLSPDKTTVILGLKFHAPGLHGDDS